MWLEEVFQRLAAYNLHSADGISPDPQGQILGSIWVHRILNFAASGCTGHADVSNIWISIDLVQIYHYHGAHLAAVECNSFEWSVSISRRE
jgi:hypothetical protein